MGEMVVGQIVMGEIVPMQNAGCVSSRSPAADDDDGVSARSRDVIRLWNAMRAQERALQSTSTSTSTSAPQAQAELFALRRRLQQAFAERDRLIASLRSRGAGD